jgi:gluconate 2-dehydrogenase gamma chain
MTGVSRRSMIKGTGALGVAMLPISRPIATAKANAALPASPAAEPPGHAARSMRAAPTTYIFFNSDEAAFIEAAVARLIPADETWPGALEAGVPNYLDKQLAGAWGAGERLYRSGPWQTGTPSQGYQLPYTPAELFRTALAAINKELVRSPFAAMRPADQDSYLKKLQTGGHDLGGVPSEVFFGHLWEGTLEGFFSDPVYGGNANMVSWRMIGFPGAYASYYDLIDQHGMQLDRAPMSLAENAHGHVHPDPGIPPRSP